MDLPVDDEPLDLMEHGCVRRVTVAAVDAAGSDDADRRALFYQRTDLYRTGVRP